jgi:cyanophycin synthetase
MTDEPARAVRLEALHLYPGANFGLRRKTALARITLAADLGPDVTERLHRAMREAAPEHALQVPPRDPDQPAAVMLGQHLRDLLLLLLGWTGEPIFEAKLLAARPQELLLAIGWERERTLRGTLEQALVLIEAGLAGHFETFHAALHQASIERAKGTAPLVARLTAAAYRRGHPVENRGDFIQIGWGSRAKRVAHAMSGATSAIAVRTARSKYHTNRLLAEAGVPVPRCAVATTLDAARDAARRLGWPVVVKPSDMEGGIAVTTGIDSDDGLARAFAAVRAQGSQAALVERHVEGDDHRLLVVRDRLLIATRRTPGGVTGDGEHRVAELVALANTDPRRGGDKQSDLLVELTLNDEAHACLAQQGLTPEAIVAPDRFVRLRHGANISQGGTAHDVTDRVHPDNRALAIRAARIVGLDIAGIDMLCPDITRSWRTVGGAICEVNAQPMLRVHWLASPERDIEGEIVDAITEGRTTRIPVTALTGHGDLSPVGLALHRIMVQAGLKPGTACSQGLLIDREHVHDGDAAGFHGARMALNDPLVDRAVLALAPPHLAQLGHPCDRYDVTAVLPAGGSPPADADRRDTLDRLIRDVLDRTRSTIVLDADDPLHRALLESGDTRRQILVADRPDNPILAAHQARGGLCVWLSVNAETPAICVASGQERSEIPLAPSASSGSGEWRSPEALLFAVALSLAHRVSVQQIHRALQAAEDGS